MERSVGCGVIVFMLFIIGVILFGIFYKNVIGNKQLFDFNQNFNTAYISFPDGTHQKIKIQYWNDYDGSDSIQIIDCNGKPFYTHLQRVILTKE